MNTTRLVILTSNTIPHILFNMAVDNFIQQADTRQNRIQSFAFVISVCLCILLCGGTVLRVVNPRQAHKIELEEKINPNDASAASLMRLPAISRARARAIVTYREVLRQQNNSRPAFNDYNDLQNVKGIGPKTIENISKWLEFGHKAGK